MVHAHHRTSGGGHRMSHALLMGLVVTPFIYQFFATLSPIIAAATNTKG